VPTISPDPYFTATADNKKSTSYTGYRCVSDFRNSGKVSKVLVKFLHKVLHVYIDNSDGLGYKFCLAVQFDKTFVEHHLVFTAITGQVADNHDIFDVTTRYLADSDKGIDDSLLPQEKSGIASQSVSQALYFLLLVSQTLLTFHGVYGLYSFFSTAAVDIDEVLRMKQLNHILLPGWVIHSTVCLISLITKQWILLIYNLPLLAWHVFSYFTYSYQFLPVKKRGLGFGLNKLLPTKPRLIFEFLYSLISQALVLYLFV